MRFCKKVTSCLFAAAVVLLCLFTLPEQTQAASESDLIFWLNDSRDGYQVRAGNKELSGELVIPATYKGLPVTTIVAFSNCTGLTKIIIPDSVTEIDRYAFEDCTALTEVVMSRNVTVIDNGTFSGCVSLARINIPSGITRIGTFAFYKCDSLACSTYGGGKYLGNSQDPYLVLIGVTDKKLNAYEVHPSTKILYDHPFFQCSQAAEFTVPASVIQIDPGAFVACNSLVRLQVAQGNPVYHSAGNCIIETAGKTLVAGCKASVIPADGSVTAIGTSAFELCHGLTQIAIPSTITTIGEQAFDACDGLTSITLPDSVTTIESMAFASCRKLTYVRLPKKLSTLESFVLSYCISLTGIEIPDSVQTIDSYAFSNCRELKHITLPDGVTTIEDNAFKNCEKLERIILPDTVQTVDTGAFAGCEQLNEVFYAGNQAQWDTLLSAVAANNDPLRNATVHLNYDFQPASVSVYVDRTNLRMATGERITLRASVQDALGNYGDPANITFQLSDSSLVDVEASGFEGDSLYIRLRGVNPGEITVTFSDSVTGYATAVPITVYANRYHSYTISNVPNISSFGLDANFANANGLYIANYSYTVNDDESTRVTFDAYNANYIYGLVEVYTQDGQLQDAVLIDKASKDNTSIKALIWDGAVCYVKAVADHSISTYKKFQHTSVKVDIPKNGYIKITCDPAESDQVMMVNAMHAVLLELSMIGDIIEFDPCNKEIPEAFLENMLKGTLPAQFKKDGYKFFTDLFKEGSKDLLLSAASVGSFTDAFLKRAQELNLIQFLGKSFGGTAIDIAEDAFLKYMGVYGAALEAYFIVGKAENLALSYNDLATAAGGGAITIQNQAGGLRAANRITLESQVDFAPDVALQTYAVALDGEFLEFIQQADQETYELLTQSICHTYNISLLQNGREVQHSDYVTVYIPIPEDLRVLSLAGNVEVYRIEEDGSFTDMDAVVEDGFVRFVTNHFSLYVLVGNGVIPGDLDGNMAVDQADVEYLLLHTLFGEADYPLDTAIGDIDGSGSIDQNDVIYLLLHTLFGDTLYPLLK